MKKLSDHDDNNTVDINFKRDTVWTLIAQIAIFLVSFLTTIMVNRTLGPYNKGVYSFIFLIPTTVLALGNLGINSSNTYFTANRKYRVNEILGNTVLFSAILSVLSVIILYVYDIVSGGKMFSGISNEYIIWIILLIPMTLFTNFGSSIIYGQGRIRQANRISVVNTVIVFVLTCVVMLIHKGNITYFVAINVVAYVVMIINTFTVIDSNMKFNLKKPILKDFFSYGSKAYISNLAAFFNYRLDMYLVLFYLGAKQLGLYSLAVMMAEKLWMVAGASSTVLFPQIASSNEDQSEFTAKVNRITFGLTFICALILAFLAKPLIVFFFKKDFVDSAYSLIWLLPGIITMTVSKVLCADLAGRGRVEVSMVASILAVVVNLVGNVILIPKLGINGASIASSISYTAQAAYILCKYKKIACVNIKNMIIVNKDDIKMVMGVIKEKLSRS